MRDRNPVRRTDRDEVDRRFRLVQVVLVVAALAFSIALTAAIAGAFSPASLFSEPEVAEIQTPESRRWNSTREAVEYEHMYSKGVKAPNFDHMYSKPRPRHY